MGSDKNDIIIVNPWSGLPTEAHVPFALTLDSMTDAGLVLTCDGYIAYLEELARHVRYRLEAARERKVREAGT